MFDGLAWNAIFQQWPWFAAAAGVFLVAVGLLLATKPRSKGQAEITDAAADKIEWAPTGRLTFLTVTQTEDLCCKWKRRGVPSLRLALSTVKFVGEAQQYPTQGWF
jgi:hypothetical protein